MKKIDYASLFTLRKDGRYCASYTDETGRHYLYDRDPAALYAKLEAAKHPAENVLLFSDVADQWEAEYRETVTPRTWNNMRPHFEEIKGRYKKVALEDVTPKDVLMHLQTAKAQGYSRTVVNTVRVIYSGIFNYAAGHGWIMYNPALAIKMPKGLPQGEAQQRRRSDPLFPHTLTARPISIGSAYAGRGETMHGTCYFPTVGL